MKNHATVLELIEYLNTLDPNDKVEMYDRPDGSRIVTYHAKEGIDFFVKARRNNS